jgi:thiol-disulfide isomerase/thioredoxin
MKHILFSVMVGFAGLSVMPVSGVDGVAGKDEAAAGPTLDQYQFGTVVANGEISKDSVQGKVVVLEMWGVHCGPCIAAMPHMVALSKRYDGKGLQVVGLHSQEAPDDEIKAMVKKLKIPFPVTTGGGGPTSENTIPRAMVFNTSGVRIFEGRPTDAGFEKAVKKALKDVAAGSASGSSAAAGGSLAEKGEKPAAAGSSLGPVAGAKPVKSGVLLPMRTWAAADGRTLSAALVSVQGGNGKFKKADGTTFTLALDKLSEDDRKIAEDAAGK